MSEKKEFQIAILGNVIRGGIGDEMVCIPCYYALRQIYPYAFVTLLCKNQNTKTLLKDNPLKIKIINITTNKGYQNKEFDICLILEHNSLEVLNLAKSIRAKRKIATLSQSLLFFKNTFSYLKTLRGGGISVYINPYWKQKYNEIERNLNLVRQINHKRFDEEINRLDFSLAKLPLVKSSSCRIKTFLFHRKEVQRKRVIGIFPFAKSSRVNFTLEEWIALAHTLCKEFPEFLFIFVNYPATQYHFPVFTQENLKIFYNKGGLEDLVAFVQSCDGIVGVDSGHIHLADNARIPTLEIISQKTSKQWAGGFYGGYFQSYNVSICWRKESQKHLESFLQKARDLLFFVKNNTKGV